MSHRELTGKARYRFDGKKIILQVEEKYLHTYHVGGSVDSEWVKEFRDAKLEDISLHEMQDLVLIP